MCDLECRTYLSSFPGSGRFVDRSLNRVPSLMAFVRLPYILASTDRAQSVPYRSIGSPVERMSDLRRSGLLPTRSNSTVRVLRRTPRSGGAKFEMRPYFTYPQTLSTGFNSGA